MAAQVFLAVFYSTQCLSQIGPTADFDSAAIPPPIFFMGDKVLCFQDPTVLRKKNVA